MAIRVSRYTKQTAVYWEKTGSSNAGQSTFKAAVEIKCRWEDRSEEVLLLDGRRVMSNAHLMIDQKKTGVLVNGSVVMLGTIADWKKQPTYPKIPTKVQGAFEIFKTAGTPDRKGRPLLFEAWL